MKLQELGKSKPDARLGAFLGVFTPTVLTILGVILYLRIGWVVGHMGLTKSIIIIILANIITLITTLSFSSIATNIRLGGGGAYYIISRSMGLEIGGAIGLPLFLSQALSVTLYSYGLAESLQIVWPGIPMQLTAFIIVGVVGLLAFKGAELALKVQIPIMIMVAVSIVILAIGAFTQGVHESIPLNPPSGEVGFWEAFAVFFPAVTGVMAGLGLSGDLKDPQTAIPRGAIPAALTGFVIYLVVPILLVIGADSETLRNDPNVWSRIAPLGALLVLPGLWGAIFSSAIGSVLGAPRTLQAMAQDQIFSKKASSLAHNRRGLTIGLILSLSIAFVAVLLGNLNAVAPVVTMFFLTVYGMVNFVAAIETLSGDSSWRPKFKVPWQINILGGIGCVIAMFLINPLASLVAVVVEIALLALLVRSEHQAGWGDARRGLYEAFVRWTLIRLSKRPMSARNWRPHILVFVDDTLQRLDHIRFASWFSQGRGVVTVNKLVYGNLLSDTPDLSGQQQEMQVILDQEGIVAFPEVDMVEEMIKGIINVSQANGLAGLESNTIMVGWPNSHKRMADFLTVMRALEKRNKSMIIGHIQPRLLYPREGRHRTIHVWWGGLQHNSDLMLLLAHLLTRNAAWRDAKIVVNSIASNEFAQAETQRNLEQLLPEIRIDADINVTVKPENAAIKDIIHSQSADAEVVFMGLAMPPVGEEEAYAKRLDDLAGNLSTVFFVKNSGMFIGQLLNPSNKEDTAQPS